MGDWIKVTDRLPAPGQRVAVLVHRPRLQLGESVGAFFTGLQFEPGSHCRGVFALRLPAGTANDYVVSGLWRPIQSAAI